VYEAKIVGQYKQGTLSKMKGATMMTKNWLLTLVGSLLAAMIVTGCADDQDPAPPETNEEQPAEENGDAGVDENAETEEGTENDNLLEDELNEEGVENGEEEGTPDPNNGTTEEGNNEGIDEGTNNTEDEKNKVE
jgi:hypothetical protein